MRENKTYVSIDNKLIPFSFCLVSLLCLFFLHHCTPSCKATHITSHSGFKNHSCSQSSHHKSYISPISQS